MSVLGKINELKNNFPKKAGQIALTHFMKGFHKGPGAGGGQTDASKNGWVPRKRQNFEKPPVRRILVKSKTLMNDIKVREANWNSGITISTSSKSEPYARVHNEGTERMVQREFIGDSKDVEKKVGEAIVKEFNKLIIPEFRNFIKMRK